MIDNLLGAAKLTSKPIHQGLKWNKASYVLKHSNVWTIKVNIKLIQTYTLSGNIISIESDTPRNIKNFKMSEDNQSTVSLFFANKVYHLNITVHSKHNIASYISSSQAWFLLISKSFCKIFARTICLLTLF